MLKTAIAILTVLVTCIPLFILGALCIIFKVVFDLIKFGVAFILIWGGCQETALLYLDL